MQNPQNIADSIVSYELKFYEITPHGDFLVSLGDFCSLFMSLWPYHISIAISDKEKFVTCLMGQNLKLPIEVGQKIDDSLKIQDALTSNEIMTQSSSLLGSSVNQIVVPLHDANGNPFGTFSLFSRPNSVDHNTKAENYKNELVQAINAGMQSAVLFRYSAEKMNQLLASNLVLFTTFDDLTESFFSISEFKFDEKSMIADNFDRKELMSGRGIYKHVLDTAQSYVSRSIDISDIQGTPFKDEQKQPFVVAPIIANDRIIGTINVGFRTGSVIDKTAVALIEDIAGYVAIFLCREILSRDLELNMELLKQKENTLQLLEKERSVREITSESMIDAREQLIQLARNMYVLCESQPQLATAVTVVSITGLLQKMTSQVLQFEREAANQNSSGREIVDLKSLIDEVLLEVEEKLINQYSTRNIVSFVNRMSASASVEINPSEFKSIFRDFLYSLTKISPEGNSIHFQSHTADGLVTISMQNYEENAHSVQQPGKTASLYGDLELLLKLTRMLFNVNNVEFSFDALSATQFRFEMAAKVASSPVQTLPDKQSEELTRSVRYQHRILIVDDDDSLRELMVDILESRHFTVDCYGDAMSAIDEFGKRKYDLVITDHGLPGISGLELAEKINEMNPAIPVIMVTGWGSDMIMTQEQNSHIDYILPKPFNLLDLLGIVENSLKLLKP